MRRIIRTPSITREIVDEIVSNQLKNIDTNLSSSLGQTPSKQFTEDEIKEICSSIIDEKKIDNQILMSVEEKQVSKNLINTIFTDEEPVKLLTITLKNDESSAFTIKLYLNIFVDDDKNVSTKYVECIWTGVKKKDEDYFLTNSDVMYSTNSIKTSSLNLDIGNVQLSTSYNQLYAIIDILPTIKGSKVGKINGYYEVIKQCENIIVL